MACCGTWSVGVLAVLSLLTTNTAAAQLMSTCVPNSPERRGEIGCSIIESKLLRAVVQGSTRRYVLAIIVHDAAQPPTMRMEDGKGPQLARCK
jgi:hypothetical protein